VPDGASQVGALLDGPVVLGAGFFEQLSSCVESLGGSSCPTSLRSRVVRLDVVVQGRVVWVGLRCAVPVLATSPGLSGNVWPWRRVWRVSS
jgi:hypothetical protein